MNPRNKIRLSILILTKDKPSLIIPCIFGLLRFVRSPGTEIVIGDTGSSNPQVLAFYQLLTQDFAKKIRIKYFKSYHFSKNNNALARMARGSHLLFLNNDTLARDDFTQPMLRRFRDVHTGIVGARLLYADETIQHAGVWVEPSESGRLISYHPFQGRSGEMGYVDKDREVASVTGACLMIERRLFEAVGGFDEAYAEECQDADLCLKVRAQGRSVWYSAKARLYHFENGTRRISELGSDRERFHARWINSPVWRGFGGAKEQNAVLFTRKGARGDVFACTAIMYAYRKKHPSELIVFASDFPELIEREPAIDIACLPEQLPRGMSFRKEISLNYETGNWIDQPGTWIDAMAASAGVRFTRDEDRRPRLAVPAKTWRRLKPLEQRLKRKRYIVISTATGAREKEWSPAGWDSFTRLALAAGLDVVRIGGKADFHPQGAIDRSGCSLIENFILLQRARAAVLLDSFPLHIAMAARTKTILLSCKTSRHTGYFSPEVTELRNRDVMELPKPFCASIGCRHKFGDGSDNPCKAPILHTLRGEVVFGHVRPLIIGKK